MGIVRVLFVLLSSLPRFVLKLANCSISSSCNATLSQFIFSFLAVSTSFFFVSPYRLQVIFGAGETNGRISKLRIYRTVFSDVDIYKSIQTLDHLKSKENEIVQTWANLAFTRSTFRKYPSQVQTDVCDKGFLACPADDGMKLDSAIYSFYFHVSTNVHEMFTT